NPGEGLASWQTLPLTPTLSPQGRREGEGGSGCWRRLQPLPASCGERSDCEAIRVRGLRAGRPFPSPRPSPREGRGEGEGGAAVAGADFNLSPPLAGRGRIAKQSG